LKSNDPLSISDRIVSRPLPIFFASLAVIMPCADSIAAWAFDAAMYWEYIWRSTSMETLISSMTASGRSVNRPPHILLLMTSRSRLLIQAGYSDFLPLIAETAQRRAGFDRHT